MVSTLDWLVVLRIYVALFQPYRNLEAGDNQSLLNIRTNTCLNVTGPGEVGRLGFRKPV